MTQSAEQRMHMTLRHDEKKAEYWDLKKRKILPCKYKCIQIIKDETTYITLPP